MDKSDKHASPGMRPHRLEFSDVNPVTQDKLALYRTLTGLTNPEALDKLLTDALPPLLREREQSLSNWTDPMERRMGDKRGQMRVDTRGAIRDDGALREQMARDAAAEDRLDRTDDRAV